jgi:hypothetical protein
MNDECQISLVEVTNNKPHAPVGELVHSERRIALVLALVKMGISDDCVTE